MVRKAYLVPLVLVPAFIVFATLVFSQGSDEDVAVANVFRDCCETDAFELCEFFGVHFQRAVFTGIEFIDAGLLDIKADGGVLLCELHGQRQADVTHADDGDMALADCIFGSSHSCLDQSGSQDFIIWKIGLMRKGG